MLNQKTKHNRQNIINHKFMRITSLLIVVALLLSCDNLKKHKEEAERHFLDGEFEMSIYYANKAIEIDSSKASLYIIRMLANENLNKIHNQISDLNSIINLQLKESKNTNVFIYERALAKEKTGQIESALIDLNYIIEEKDTLFKLTELYINKGSFLYELGDLKEALKFYNLAEVENISDNPVFNSNILLGKAIIESDNKNYKRAKVLLNKSIIIDSTNYKSYVERANINIELNNLKDVYTDYNKAIELNSLDSRVFSNIAFFQLKYSEEYSKSIKNFTRAINLSQDSMENYVLYKNRSIAKSRLGNFEGALGDIEKSSRLYSDDPTVFYNYSLILRRLLRDEEALEKINISINLGANDIEYYNLRTDILSDLSIK